MIILVDPETTRICMQRHQDWAALLTHRLQERLSISAQHARAAALVQLRGVLVEQVQCP